MLKACLHKFNRFACNDLNKGNAHTHGQIHVKMRGTLELVVIFEQYLCTSIGYVRDATFEECFEVSVFSPLCFHCVLGFVLLKDKQSVKFGGGEERKKKFIFSVYAKKMFNFAF